MSDLWALYQYNVFDALDSGDMRLLWILINRLSYEPKSLWRAKALAESPAVGLQQTQERDHVIEWFGWDTQASILASVYDKLDIILDAVMKHGMKHKRIKLDNPYPRPGSSRQYVARSTDDLFNFFGSELT